MNILGIESSCDETAASVCSNGKILSNVISTQAIHEKYGGVVPELASRAHHKTITQTVDQALRESGVLLKNIDAIAVAQGPGLMGSLLVGISFAKGLAITQKIPIIGVNHIEAHMYANFIEHEESYPAVALIVSGGHTRLVHLKAAFKHQLLGKTRDDAAGEAFDKIGKILKLPYPAGPIVDKLSRTGDPEFYSFPRSMIRQGLDFSFSGLKTSVLYYTQKQKESYIEDHINDICASVSAAITDVLISKLRRAVKKTDVQTVMLAGGVSANSMLREKAKNMADELDLQLLIPSLEYCTDNAAMIAITGSLKAREGMFDDLSLKPFARMG